MDLEGYFTHPANCYPGLSTMIELKRFATRKMEYIRDYINAEASPCEVGELQRFCRNVLNGYRYGGNYFWNILVSQILPDL